MGFVEIILLFDGVSNYDFDLELGFEWIRELFVKKLEVLLWYFMSGVCYEFLIKKEL